MTDDKRRHPRVARSIRVRSFSREAVELETIDLSAGGFFCTAPAFLPPMTKMAVSLVLPQPWPSEPKGEQVVNGEAIVVRTEPPAPASAANGYRVALFFSRMEESDRQRLLRFLANHAGKAGD